jgi:hypothetical protein
MRLNFGVRLLITTFATGFMKHVLIVFCFGCLVIGCQPTGSQAWANGLDPRFQTLTRDLLAELPDSMVAAAVYQHALWSIGGRFDREVQIVSTLPSGVQAVYATLLLESEVYNGGFNQYFWNSTGALADVALRGFELLGATEHARLTREAIEIGNSEASMRRMYKRKGTTEAFSESYKHTNLGSLDEQFFALEGADELRMRLVRTRLDLFISP